MSKTVGVLALQGCVDPHVSHLEALQVNVLKVKKPEQLDKCDALIVPGGESTTFLKLLDVFQFYPALERFHQSGKPVWGICAGAILISKSVLNPVQKSLGWIDIEIERNAYGRQLESQNLDLRGTQVALIRAPRIKSKINSSVQTLDQHANEILSVKQGPYIASTFHPELSQEVPSPFHREFVSLIQ
jgi:5'-phosphate synthase pdxT subunit